MQRILSATAIALAITAGVAAAQTPPMAPPDGTLSTTRESHSSNPDGSQVDSKSTTYRNTNGVADDSSTTTTTVPAPPPPPPVTTTTTTTNSTNYPR